MEPARNQAVKFLVVGGIGFLVDAGIMVVLVRLAELSPLVARTLSFPIALTVTWTLNRNWTFGTGRVRTVGVQYTLYLGIQLVGLAINFGLFAWLIERHAFWQARPVFALAVGAGGAIIFTFVMSRSVAFAAPRPKEPPSRAHGHLK